MSSIFNGILKDQELKTVLKPCNHKQYGAFYAIAIFTILLSILAVIILYRICKFTCVKIGEQLKKREAVKVAEVKQEARLNRFSGFERDLFVSDNTLYYAIRSYTNKNNKLIMYVDFFVRGAQAQYINVSDTVDEYLKEKICYGLQSYRGRSEALKGSKMLVDMGEMYLAQSLTRAYGSDIEIKQIDSVYGQPV